MTVNVSNESKVRFDFSFKKVAEAVVDRVLKHEGLTFSPEISVLITDNEGIRKLNFEHRGIDAPTDVLSFPMIDFETPSDFSSIGGHESYIDPSSGEVLLGDIVISLDKIIEQAKAYGHSRKREYAFLVAHSTLHLLGYDHLRSKREEQLMEEKQEKALSELSIVRKKVSVSDIRNKLKNKKRIVIKIGSASLAHKETGRLDLIKLETLVREICDLQNQGKEVVLVSSGAIMVGKNTLNIKRPLKNITEKQACASVGQAKLMMIYQKLFSEYNHLCSQVLMTKNTMLDNLNRFNARNTFMELLSMGVIPIVNENDTIATYEIDNVSVFGDNDNLSAVVAALVHADLLILLSDIDGLYTDNPRENPDAEFIEVVETLDEAHMKMGKNTTGSSVGTGGMATKLSAAKIATAAGADMVIANGNDFHNIHAIMAGENVGTIFLEDKKDELYLINYLEHVF